MRPFVLALAALAWSAASGPAEAQDQCAAMIDATCLASLGAGSTASNPECAPKWQAYRDCLSAVAGGAGGANLGDVSCGEQTAMSLWTSAEADNDCLGYLAYLDSCPRAPQARFARSRLQRLGCSGFETAIAAAGGDPTVMAGAPGDTGGKGKPTPGAVETPEARYARELSDLGAEAIAAALKGDQGHALFALGTTFDTGLGGADDATAARLYGPACELGSAMACTNLGFLYDLGRGVAEDNPRSAELNQRGCDGGNALGCFNVGLLYEKGEGVALDYAIAADLYRRACEGGAPAGCTNYGGMLRDAKGVTPDDVAAVEKFRMGCDGGNAIGCTNLAYMYQTGRGVAQSNDEAIRLYRMAVAGGETGYAPGALEALGAQP